ncbi:hypothetical protein JZU54_05940 [bacterium]|nr:hypothetical protein [bacterium]
MLVSGGYINTGFDAVTLSGQLPAAVTFDTVALTGIFNPTSGGAAQQSVDPTILARSSAIDGYWVYRGDNVTMKGVGVAGTSDYTMMVSGLKQSICQQINYALHGTSLLTAPVSLAAADAAIIGAPTAATPSIAPVTANGVVFDLSAVALAATGWMNGCYATTTVVGTGVNYIYIHTLLAQ